MGLVVFEGADGCGKDSVADAVAQVLEAERLNFPNDKGVTGPMIREYLRREWLVKSIKRPGPTEYEEAVWAGGSALAFQALQLMNRMEVWPQLNEAAETDHHLVLARYWQSGWVYGQLDGLDGDFLERVHAGLPKPALNILLDVSPETCMERRAKRDGKLTPERYEGKLESTRTIVTMYRDLWARRMAIPDDGSWYIIDARRPLGDVIADAIEACNGSL